ALLASGPAIAAEPTTPCTVTRRRLLPRGRGVPAANRGANDVTRPRLHRCSIERAYPRAFRGSFKPWDASLRIRLLWRQGDRLAWRRSCRRGRKSKRLTHEHHFAFDVGLDSR